MARLFISPLGKRVNGDEDEQKSARYRVAYCTRTSPLPLLPSGPGGVGGIASRRTRYLTSYFNKFFVAHAGTAALCGIF